MQLRFFKTKDLARLKVWVALGVLAVPVTLEAGETKSPNPGQAFLQIENKKREEITPELRALIIDKPRIAEETVRMIGLRKAGNPHIQKGEGLLLPDLNMDPRRSQVDLKKLRQERIAMIERRAPRTPSTHTVTSPERKPRGAESKQAVATEEGRDTFGLGFPGVAVLFGALTLLWVWKRRQ